MSRDRIVISVLAAAALVGGFWFAMLGPKREAVRRLDSEIATQRQRLERAQATAAQARAARARYDADYSAVVMLGKAVPEQDGLPSLLYQIDSSARDAKIDFSSITSNSGASQAGGTASAAAPATGGSTPAAGAPASAGATTAVAPTALPLSFVFSGSFFDMEHMLDRVHRFVRPGGADLAIRGRLLSVDDIALAPASDGFPNVQATISASAYTMPAARTPDGAAATGTATPAATSTTTTATGTTP
jgi:hypothetical protein